jgi:hypothetical protein
LVEKESKKEKTLYHNLTGNSRIFGIVAMGGFAITLLTLLLVYFLRVYKFQNLDGNWGKAFDGIADFFGLAAFFGFGVMILGLLSLALVGKDVHLYLRIGLLITIGLIVGRFLSLQFFF